MGGGIKKGDFADDVGETTDEESQCACCTRGFVGIVEWDLGDELGDEAGVSLGGVDTVLVEVKSKSLSRKGASSGGEEEWVRDCGFEVRRRCDRVEMLCQCLHC